MQYFTQEFIDYYIDLSRNNNKEWFHTNKKRYETIVKEPFLQLMADLITEVKTFDTSIQLDVKDSIYRVNRDIRFSQDKSPYKLHVSGVISPLGKKDHSIPGIYLEFSPEEAGIYGGCYCLSKEQIFSLRNYISNNIPQFRKVIENPDFVKSCGPILGEENKIIPKEFKAAFEKEPLIAKKQMYFVVNHSADFITSPDLKQNIMNYWHAARPFNDFLMNAIK